MIIKYFKDYIESINEGLIKTYPGEIVLKDILKSLEQLHINVSGSFEDNKIRLNIHNFNGIPLNKISHLFDHIDTFVVNRGGWFPSIMNITKLTNINKLSKYNFNDIIRIHDEIDSISITYESKFDIEESNIPKTLYHLTIKEYCKNINKMGLVPKSKSKLSSHLDRIYLCKKYQDCVDLIPKMMLYYTGEEDENIYKLGKKFFNKDITPVIYEIDNSSNIIEKLYLDINYGERGYYTLNNIPKDKIKILSNN
jgi:hypothetical protein